MKRQERTIKTAVEFRGCGLHSGREVAVKLKPAAAGEGIVFNRTDLPDAPAIPASIEFLAPATRRTSLGNGKAQVETVEHLLAACHGLGIDNLNVELDGAEIPGTDGSSLPIAEMLQRAGIVEQKTPRKLFVLEDPLYIHEGDVTLVALPSDEGLSIQYHAVFDPPQDGHQGAANLHPMVMSCSYRLNREDFSATIAPARTFCLAHEVEKLRDAGFGKGATIENTVVIGHESQEWRFGDEPARHKILDLLGDLQLVGADLCAHVIATRSGHRTNAELVKLLREVLEQREARGDLPRETSLDIHSILRLLPHRYPFLLIDRVLELEGYRKAVGIKNVTFNEPFFQGHWPDQPIMPGVLQLEAMAQLAGVLLLRKLENTGKLAVLWAIDKVKLRGTVSPGDQLRIEVEALKVKPSLSLVQGRCKVGARLVSEATLMFTMVDAS